MQFVILNMRKLNFLLIITRCGKYILSTAHFQILIRLFQDITDETTDFIDQSNTRYLDF